MLEFEEKELDKGVILGRERTNNEVGIYLCLGYDKEIIDMELDKWFYDFIRHTLCFEVDFKRDMILGVDSCLDEIEICTYSIGVVQVITQGYENVLQNYIQGKVRNDTLELVEKVFKEPCYDCFINAINMTDGHYICLKEERDIDTWLLNSILIGTCSNKKYYTRKEMKTYIQDVLYSKYQEGLKDIESIKEDLLVHAEYCTEYDQYHVYIEIQKDATKIVWLYLGKTILGRDAWVKLATVDYVDLYVLFYKEHRYDFKEILQDRVFQGEISKGKKKVYKVRYLDDYKLACVTWNFKKKLYQRGIRLDV